MVFRAAARARGDRGAQRPPPPHRRGGAAAPPDGGGPRTGAPPMVRGSCAARRPSYCVLMGISPCATRVCSCYGVEERDGCAGQGCVAAGVGPTSLRAIVGEGACRGDAGGSDALHRPRPPPGPAVPRSRCTGRRELEGRRPGGRRGSARRSRLRQQRGSRREPVGITGGVASIPKACGKACGGAAERGGATRAVSARPAHALLQPAPLPPPAAGVDGGRLGGLGRAAA
jgi:hypothetical protein